MTQKHIVVERDNHIGPSPEQWAVIGAKAKITVTTEVSALSTQGQFMHYSNSTDLACLDLMELTDTDSHNDNVGGETDMMEQVANMFLEISVVDSVYYYEVHGEIHITAICLQDQDDLSDLIAEVQMKAYDKYSENYFEVKYVIKDRFNFDSIPDTATLASKEG